jgi:hypothetical protein
MSDSIEATSTRPEVAILIRDGETPGTIDVAATGVPAEFDPTSPAHIIADFIRRNFAIIVDGAQAEVKARAAAASQLEREADHAAANDGEQA